jgi:hypothetical protein
MVGRSRVATCLSSTLRSQHTHSRPLCTCHASLNTRTGAWLSFCGYSFDDTRYAGQLPTAAFGVNSYGVGFTLNYVEPVKAVWPGIARNFVSRSLLDAVSFDDAVKKATVPGQGSGHNIQARLSAFAETSPSACLSRVTCVDETTFPCSCLVLRSELSQILKPLATISWSRSWMLDRSRYSMRICACVACWSRNGFPLLAPSLRCSPWAYFCVFCE